MFSSLCLCRKKTSLEKEIMSHQPLPVIIPTTTLPSGEDIPILGQGTWRMGENPQLKAAELKALRYGLERGMTLIYTAEMYGDGGAEILVSEAIAGRRDDLFIVSKVLPTNAGYKETISACERSLQRLKTDRLDLYLLHWRGTVPLSETVDAFQKLVSMEKIRHWGVSNLDMASMQELVALPGGNAVATNQILYNPLRRGAEWDLIPWCHQRNMSIMAYSPLDEGSIVKHPVIMQLANQLEVAPAQVAMAWLLRQPQIISIPKATQLLHIDENLAALNIVLDKSMLEQIDRAFPPPTASRSLEIN